MSTVSRFLDRVTDPLRGASPIPANAAVHGGGYVSPSPAIAGWLANNEPIAETLGRVQGAVAALEGQADGALSAFDKARERFDAAKAAEANIHYDARQMGRAADPELAKRALQARKAALTSNEDAASRASAASQDYASTRTALNAAISYVGTLAAERRTVTMASPVALPKGGDIIAAQRRVIAGLTVEMEGITAAPPPLEDAIAMVRASVAGQAPQIGIGPQRVDWILPQQRLNATPRVGDGLVEIDDASALVQWLFADQLRDRLEELVRQKYIGVEVTYSPIERRKALTAVQGRLLTAERLEVAAVFKAWADGQFVPLRKDVSAMALLGIESVGDDAVQDPPGYVGTAFLGTGANR